MDWNRVRAEFPALAHWTYLNSATMGHLPRRAEQAALDHLAHRNALACSDFLNWYDDLDRLRAKLALLFGAKASDYAFFQGAAPVLSLLLGGIPWKPGDRIVTLTDEFPNQTYYASLLADQGVELIETPWEKFYEAVDGGRTRLVALSAMSYTTGFRPPLEEISRQLRPRNILFFVDGTQGAGALHYDMAKIDPDIFAVHAYKWMLAPAGAAFAYLAPRVREWLAPHVIGWRSHHDWRNVNALHQGRPVLSQLAERYEGCMQPALLQYMLEASVDLMLEIGARAIEQRVLHLARLLRNEVERLGGQVITVGDSPIVAVRFPGQDSGQLARTLKEQRVVVSARQGNLRVSTHLFNNEDDLTRLIHLTSASR